MNACEFLEPALSGDETAWDELFKCLWPVVAGVASSMLRGMATASIDDAAQNTFVRLTEDGCRRLRLYDAGRGNLERYVAKIAHNCTLDYLRANARHLGTRDLSFVPEPEQESKNPSNRIYPWELTAALGVLSAREREVIEMLYYDHCGTAEVAACLGIGADTVRSLKSHAVQKMRKFFDC